jgi:dipeptidase E
MGKRLLLLSNSANYQKEFLAHARDEIKRLFDNQVKHVLFFPYAGVTFTFDEYTAKVSRVLNELGYEVRPVHREKDPLAAVQNAEAITIAGGNTFRLVYMLYKTGVMGAIREKVDSGTPYLGWSAGINVSCPTLRTTNDMPIIEPPSFETLNLVPFQINPHYTDFIQPDHTGETREQRIREFITINQTVPVVGLREGTMLRIEGSVMKLIGDKPLRLFQYGEPPREYPPDSNLDYLLR